MPLTSNPVKWKSKLHFRSDFRDNFLCRSIFWFSPTQPSLVWEDLIFFFFSFFMAVDPMANSEWWPSVFSVRWVCWAFSPTRKWQHPSFSPTRNSAKPFSPLTQGRGWRVCGTHWCVQKQHLACSGVGLYNSEECLDFLHRVDYSLDTAYIAI